VCGWLVFTKEPVTVTQPLGAGPVQMPTTLHEVRRCGSRSGGRLGTGLQRLTTFAAPEAPCRPPPLTKPQSCSTGLEGLIESLGYGVDVRRSSTSAALLKLPSADMLSVAPIQNRRRGEMSMVGEAIAGLSAFGSMFNIAKSIKDMNDAVVRNQAVYELWEHIIAAQARYTEAVQKINELEAKISRFENWDAERERYVLTDFGGSTFA
jgi:hypothetical protein